MSAPFPLPPEFVDENPRFTNFILSPKDTEIPNIRITASVAALQVVLPLNQKPSGYASVVENTLVLNTTAEEPVSVLSETPAGGSSITHEELMALPGAVQFVEALMTKLLENWLSSLQPPT